MDVVGLVFSGFIFGWGAQLKERMWIIDSAVEKDEASAESYSPV